MISLQTVLSAGITAIIAIFIYLLKDLRNSIDNIKVDNKENQIEIKNISDRLIKIEFQQNSTLVRLEKIESEIQILKSNQTQGLFEFKREQFIVRKRSDTNENIENDITKKQIKGR